MKNRITILILVFIVLHALELICQTDSISNKIFIRNAAENGTPIEELTKYAPIYPNKIYLFADFDYVTSINTKGNKDLKYIPVYIINNTDKEFSFTYFEKQALQQVYRVGKNNWVRSQRHTYSTCGSSYSWRLELGPKRFYKVQKFFPVEGEKKIVRYIFFNTEVLGSNAGFGMVDMDEVDKARFDRLALNISSSEFLMDIINKKIEPYETDKESKKLVENAIESLAWRFPEIAVPILEEIGNNESNPFQEKAKKNLELIKKWRKNKEE